MEPLSITTGVITILQATTTVITICYNFRAALKNESWSLTSIINELKGLRDILERLEELIQDKDHKNGSTTGTASDMLFKLHNGPLLVCQKELKALEETIQGASHAQTQGSKRRAFLQAVHWQIKDKDAEECLERIQRCKSTLILALGGEQALVPFHVSHW
jgi:hypothetical protein